MKGKTQAMKKNRHKVILEIIETQDIQTQNQLMHALEKRGIDP